MWVTNHYYFDLKKVELLLKPDLPEGLFGLSMTKPQRTANNDIIFFVAGGALDINETKIY
jgi:hypothetical protein